MCHLLYSAQWEGAEERAASSETCKSNAPNCCWVQEEIQSRKGQVRINKDWDDPVHSGKASKQWFSSVLAPEVLEYHLMGEQRNGVPQAGCSAQAPGSPGALGSPALAPAVSLVKLHPSVAPWGLVKGLISISQCLSHRLLHPHPSGKGSRALPGGSSCGTLEHHPGK